MIDILNFWLNSKWPPVSTINTTNDWATCFLWKKICFLSRANQLQGLWYDIGTFFSLNSKWPPISARNPINACISNSNRHRVPLFVAKYMYSGWRNQLHYLWFDIQIHFLLNSKFKMAANIYKKYSKWLNFKF